VSDGEHLLLADDPLAFADACARALTDPDLRDTLVRSGREHFERNFERGDAMARIRGFVLPLMSGSAR
jgi:hypothetical protein